MDAATKNHLLIIDPQIDFCDIQPEKIGGQTPRLAVAGGLQCITNISNFIDGHMLNINEITVSLDSHHIVDIAHTEFWCDENGETPLPFTQITAEMVKNKQYYPKRSEWHQLSLDYLSQLESKNNYAHTLWPPHTLIGTVGHAIVPVLAELLSAWEIANQKNVTYILKGTQPFTEHFSVIAAEVGNPVFPETMPNQELIHSLAKCQLLIVGGLASSHCLKSTVEDIVRFSPGSRQQRVLLKDTTKPVAGFEMLEQSLYTFLDKHKWIVSDSVTYNGITNTVV